MKTLLVLGLILLVLFAVGLPFLKRMGSGADQPWPFHAKRLLSQPEQVLYHRLVQALPEDIVLAQVQVSRVLGVNKGHQFHEWNNRINRLSYDFVVCSKDGGVKAVIELDDRSHESATRTATDGKKDRATAAAGIRMIRWNVKSLPDLAAIQVAVTPPQANLPTSASPRDAGKPEQSAVRPSWPVILIAGASRTSVVGVVRRGLGI